MKRPALLLPLLLLAAISFASRTRSQIELQYKRWARAALSNDVDGVLAILSPNYALKTFDGKVIALKDYATSLRKRKASGKKPATYTTSIESLSQQGNAVIVISLETSITQTPDPITNKLQKLIHVHQYRDTWLRASGSWKLATTVTLIEKTTIGR